MIINIGNAGYFLFIVIALSIAILAILFLKNKTDRFRYWFILGISASALVLHFSKLLFEPYRSTISTSIVSITFDNICAVSTLIFPFIYISKSEKLKDYMVYMGIISGVCAMFFPTEALGRDPFTFDVLRFYYAHIAIFLAPMLMVVYKVHRPNYLKIWRLSVMFFGIMAIIVVNEVILIGAGLVDADTLLDVNVRNESLIFGFNSDVEGAKNMVLWCVPKLFLTNPLTQEPAYWPIIWIMIPYFIYASITSFLISLTYDFKRIQRDFYNVAIKIKKRLIRKKKQDPTI